MSVNILVSTGTMVGKSNGYDYERALCEIKKLEDKGLCFGCELMMLTYYYDKLDILIESVKRWKVTPAVIHCEKEIGSIISDAGILFSRGIKDEANELYAKALSLFKMNCYTANKLDIQRMVLHLWGGISSDKNIEYNVSKLTELEEVAAEYDVRLLIENIPSNTNDPLSNWHRVLPVLKNGGLVFDSRFGKLHEQIAETLTDSEIIPHIEHIHISDYTGGYRNFKALRPILHPRDGVIDFVEVAEYIKRINYSGTLTLESPIMNDEALDILKLEDTLRYLDGLFN